MRRDDDLVRQILLTIEESSDTLSVNRMSIAQASREEIVYHLQLLDDAGFIEAKFLCGDNVVLEVLINRLTWAGHEFLDAVRDDTTWATAKSRVASTVGSASLQILQAVATSIIMAKLGLGPA